RVFPSGAVHAEGGGYRCCSIPRRDGRPRGRGGHQGGRRGQASGRDAPATLPRGPAGAIKAVDEPKKAAATTARETATLTASLRKLEGLKKSADAELALADKALAAAKTDQARGQAE